MEDAHGRYLGRPRQQVVRERRCERLAVLIVRAFLIHRGADALRRAAERLAVDDHGIHQRPAILDDHVVEDLDASKLGIHRNRSSMRSIAEGAAVDLRLEADRGFEPAEIDIGRQPFRPQIPGLRDLAQRDRTLRPMIAPFSRCRPRIASDARRS